MVGLPDLMFSEKRGAARYIVSEANGTRSREVATVKASQDLNSGQVVAFDSNGKLVPADPNASAPQNQAVGVLYDSIDTSNGEREEVYHARDAEVDYQELRFNGLAQADQGTLVSQLEGLGIVVRKSTQVVGF